VNKDHVNGGSVWRTYKARRKQGPGELRELVDAPVGDTRVLGLSGLERMLRAYGQQDKGGPRMMLCSDDIRSEIWDDGVTAVNA
jgi:hypothetical protein